MNKEWMKIILGNFEIKCCIVSVKLILWWNKMLFCWNNKRLFMIKKKKEKCYIYDMYRKEDI